MESSQLRKVSIIGISVLCLSPVEFFSNQLFENRKEETTQVVISTDEMKLKPNYLSSNYEIFNPEIKTTSEDIEKLVNENKEKEIIEYENKLESEKAKKAEEERKEEERRQQEERKQQEAKRKEEERKRAEKARQEAATSTTNQEASITANNAQVKTVEEQAVPQPNTDVATSIVNYALQFVGNPYVPNGTDLYNGVDCSGFTMKVYEHFGYSLPHRSTVQATYGTSVSVDQMAPGDLIFYGYNGRVSHVALYIGNGRIVHAATSSQGIVTASYQIMPIITVRRILN